MNPQFWQMTAGQAFTGLCAVIGMIGSAWIFTWKMGQMHGQNLATIGGLADDIKQQVELVRHHGDELNQLRALAESSQERLRLLEEEMRDNRKRRDRPTH